MKVTGLSLDILYVFIVSSLETLAVIKVYTSVFVKTLPSRRD